MRARLAALWLLALAGPARADRLLFMPTARLAPPGEIRLDAWQRPSSGSGLLVSGALNQSFEAEFSQDGFRGDSGRPTASFAYNYLSPVADLTPGLALGVRDALNATGDGRRAYVCATLDRAAPALGSGYVEFTAGVQFGRRAGPLLGARAPLGRGLELLAEYDGVRFDAGLRLRLARGASVQLAYRGADLLAGLEVRLR